MKNQREIKIISFLFLTIFIACEVPVSNTISKESHNFKTYCGTCHKLPNPKNLTKEIWRNSVLPRMGLHLGIPNSKIDFRNKLSEKEQAIIAEGNIYPDEQIITDEEWLELKKYIINLAPERIGLDSSRLIRNSESTQFSQIELPVDNLYGSTITAIEFDDLKDELWMANFDNQLFHWTKKGNKQIQMQNPVVDFHCTNKGILITEIGQLFPSDLKLGSISLLTEQKKIELLSQIRRPVHSEYHDLNNNGSEEIIVAQYGNLLGGLYLYYKENGEYTEIPLLKLPGAIKFYVSDINDDGLKDITALFAQGDESIWQFIQNENLQFTAERILRFSPEFGTSDFELIDFNNDGQLDIITAHGDNADYSYILKPHHGIRIHINNNNQFEEKYFYPIYGSTKVITEDFDKDGDIDIATSAFFPDFDLLLNESFVYLENINSENFKFRSQTFNSTIPIRSLCLEKADFDADGDVDLILGLFGISPQPIPNHLKEVWNNSKHDIVVMSNNLY